MLAPPCSSKMAGPTWPFAQLKCSAVFCELSRVLDRAPNFNRSDTHWKEEMEEGDESLELVVAYSINRTF